MAAKKSSKKGKAPARRRPRVLVLGASGADNIRKAGGEPVTISATDPRAAEAASHENIHAVLLLGGGDVDPSWYGAEKTGDVYGVDEQRDLVELAVLDAAAKRGLPVLGICRGSQIMNVHAGGTLHVDHGHDGHWGTRHLAKARKGSKLAKAWQRDSASVISYHHQAVDVVGEGLRVAAESHDGLVEAVESVAGQWRLGVQFHPEMARGDESAQAIFDAFVYQAGLVAGVKVIPDRWNRPITSPAPAQRPKSRRVSVPQSVEKARKGRQYSGTWGGDVRVTWRCFRGCRIQFDLEVDYVDHMRLLHGEDLDDTYTSSMEMPGTDRSPVK